MIRGRRPCNLSTCNNNSNIHKDKAYVYVYADNTYNAIDGSDRDNNDLNRRCATSTERPTYSSSLLCVIQSVSYLRQYSGESCRVYSTYQLKYYHTHVQSSFMIRCNRCLRLPAKSVGTSSSTHCDWPLILPSLPRREVE